MNWPPKDTEFVRYAPGEYAWQDIVAATVGWGFGDDPPGRRQAYLDLIAPNDPPATQLQYGRLSGCAMSALGWMRLYGLADPELWRLYRLGRAVADVVAIARRHGAWEGPSAIPEPGDLVLIGGPGSGGPEHVLCVVSWGATCSSIDGGQVDIGGQAIREITRPVRRVGRATWIGGRRLAGLVRVDRLAPSLPSYLPERR